jgi:transposase
MVSQDGGVPFMSKSHDGNASDNNVFKQRSEGLLKEFATSESPRYLVADSKLYTQENAVNLAHLPFITRIGGNLKILDEVIEQCLAMGNWQPYDDESYRYQRLDLCHYGIEQRWLVVYSDNAYHRAVKTLSKAQSREQEKVSKQLFHLQAQRFESEESARKALDKIVQNLSYHKLVDIKLTQHVKYASCGKPKSDSSIKCIVWQISGTVVPDEAKLSAKQHHESCFVVGTSIPDTELSDVEVIKGYKGQGAVERGFSFLKSPVFFVSSLFVKKPSRIEGLLSVLPSLGGTRMVMTLALLVYSVAQRWLRNRLSIEGETLPNQINQPTSRPTLRWIFQCMEGIHRVLLNIDGQVTCIVDGITDLRVKIIRLFGQRVCQIYRISSA